MIWNEVICLGDSLTYGARDEYERSYTSELPPILEKITNEIWICHNYGHKWGNFVKSFKTFLEKCFFSPSSQNSLLNDWNNDTKLQHLVKYIGIISDK